MSCFVDFIFINLLFMEKFTHKPMKTCVLRTHGLTSVKGAMFGLTRRNKNGKPRAHQGIDLATDVGYRCYAVEDGTIVSIAIGKDGYGYTVTLKMNKPNTVLNNKYAFYAHLSRIDVKVGSKVKAGDVIGLSGDTGNAKGMNKITKGGHLHFELRDRQVCGLGLSYRLDPLPFIDIL